MSRVTYLPPALILDPIHAATQSLVLVPLLPVHAICVVTLVTGQMHVLARVATMVLPMERPAHGAEDASEEEAGEGETQVHGEVEKLKQTQSWTWISVLINECSLLQIL